jgi:hypothetical protein
MAGTMTITVRGGRSMVAGLAFLTTSTVVSAGVGLVIGSFGGILPERASLAVAALVSVAYLASFVVVGRVPFLPWPPQLPARWIDWTRPCFTAIRYAAIWGLAFVTPIRAGSLAVLAAIVLMLRDPAAGALLFGMVGCLRGLPTAMAPLRPSHDTPGQRALATAWQRPLVVGLDAVALTSVLAVMSQTALGP